VIQKEVVHIKLDVCALCLTKCDICIAIMHTSDLNMEVIYEKINIFSGNNSIHFKRTLEKLKVLYLNFRRHKSVALHH
jgi:hypothetical protein